MVHCRCDSATHPDVHEPGRCGAEAVTRDGYCQACVTEIMGDPSGSRGRGGDDEPGDGPTGKTSS
jgi:hypothetical protein